MVKRSEQLNKILKILFWLVVIVLLLFPVIQKITYDPEIIEEHRDVSWLTGDPCSVPCWYGLIPGESTIDYVVEVVENLPFVLVETREEFLGKGNDYIAYDLHVHDKGDGGVSFQFSNGILSRINQSLNYKITLSEVVSTQGEPDYIEAIEHLQIRGDGYCDVDLVWDDKKLVAGYRIVDGENFWIVCEEIANGRKLDGSQLVGGFSIIGENLEFSKWSYPWPGLSE